MVRSKLILIAITIALNSCYQLHFKNGNITEGNTEVETWHHNVVLSLIEVSDPVNPIQDCDNKNWTMVTTEDTFLTTIAGGIVNSLLLGLPIWDPQLVTVQCEN